LLIVAAMTPHELQARTKDFALRCLKVAAALPRSIRGRTIAGQLARAATSAAANYRAACRARSKAEFIAKIGIVEKEAGETAFWLDLAVDAKAVTATKLTELLRGADELVCIVAASHISATRRRANQQPSGARWTAKGSPKGEGGSPNQSAISNQQ
jgi:four helix bundle protein